MTDLTPAALIGTKEANGRTDERGAFGREIGMAV